MRSVGPVVLGAVLIARSEP